MKPELRAFIESFDRHSAILAECTSVTEWWRTDDGAPRLIAQQRNGQRIRFAVLEPLVSEFRTQITE